MEGEIIRLFGVLARRGEQAAESLLQPLAPREKAELLRLLTVVAAGGGEGEHGPSRTAIRPGLRPSGPMSRSPQKPPHYRGEEAAEGRVQASAVPPAGSYERLPDGGIRCMECQVGCILRKSEGGKLTGFRCPLGQKLAAML